ncbi:excinuclease ABC subunit A [Haemophilus influenzae]|uniref:Excinuclease ABC subunit A n=1 Tax=Haemophilus influenzae TaxID=727 RepID=A0A2X1PNW4_HAEIF|nr:excinuclease ABC subunit A [Haemophilus influenzae]
MALLPKILLRDKSQNDFTSFVSGDYVWNVDSGLTLDKFDSVVPVNLIQKGKSSDNIIVKNCDVNVKATKKANL